MPDQYTAYVWTEAESAGKKLRIEKYPDTSAVTSVPDVCPETSSWTSSSS